MKEEKRFVIGGSFETIDGNNNTCIIDIPLYHSQFKEEPLISSYLDKYSVWAEERGHREIVLVVYRGLKTVRENLIKFNIFFVLFLRLALCMVNVQ